MRIVVITPPHAVPREAATIRLLLDAGIDRVHIRKPEASREELCALLEAIPEPLRPRLSLHDGHCLATRYGIGGVHLNARNPLPPEGFRGVVSRSCHSLDELAADYQYKDRIDFYKVDIDREQELAAVFGVRSVPTLLFIPLSGMPQMMTGGRPKSDLKRIIDEVLMGK